MLEKALGKLRELTNHKHIKLTDSGDSAIHIALHIVKQTGRKKIIIPDQGGWLSYKKFPELVGLEIVEVDTHYGLVDLGDLEQKADSESALIIPGLAGYIAEQPLEKISEICKEKNCMFIEDASGSFGNENLCKGEFADIIIGSFGRWEPIDLNHGGFISTDNHEFFKDNDHLFEGREFDEEKLEMLIEKLESITPRVQFLREVCGKIKQDLSEHEIVHRDHPGIVVVVKFSNEDDKQKIIKYCEENNFEHTLCPRYIRINEDAISIEVKRLEG